MRAWWARRPRPRTCARCACCYRRRCRYFASRRPCAVSPGRGDEGGDKVRQLENTGCQGSTGAAAQRVVRGRRRAARPRRDSVAIRCTGQRRRRAAASAKSCWPRGGVCAVGVCAHATAIPSVGRTQQTHPRARELTLAWACPCRCSGSRACTARPCTRPRPRNRRPGPLRPCGRRPCTGPGRLGGAA